MLSYLSQSYRAVLFFIGRAFAAVLSGHPFLVAQALAWAFVFWFYVSTTASIPYADFFVTDKLLIVLSLQALVMVFINDSTAPRFLREEFQRDSFRFSALMAGEFIAGLIAVLPSVLLYGLLMDRFAMIPGLVFLTGSMHFLILNLGRYMFELGKVFIGNRTGFILPVLFVAFLIFSRYSIVEILTVILNPWQNPAFAFDPLRGAKLVLSNNPVLNRILFLGLILVLWSFPPKKTWKASLVRTIREIKWNPFRRKSEPQPAPKDTM